MGVRELANEMIRRELYSGLTVAPPFAVRLDIRNSKRLCKRHFQRQGQLSLDFHAKLVRVARHIMREEPWLDIAYIQSDELNLVCVDKEPPFRGRVEKIDSVLSGEASSLLTRELLADGIDNVVAFDARVVKLDSMSQIKDYLAWRRADCFRNAINWYSARLAGPKAVQGKKLSERVFIVVSHGLQIPPEILWGTIIIRVLTRLKATNRKTGRAVTVVRSALKSYTGNLLERSISPERERKKRSPLLAVLTRRAKPI